MIFNLVCFANCKYYNCVKNQRLAYVCFSPTEFNRISRRNKHFFFLFISIFILSCFCLLLFFQRQWTVDSHLLSDSCLHTLHAITDLVDSFVMFFFSTIFFCRPCRRCRWQFFNVFASFNFLHSLHSKFRNSMMLVAHLSLFNFVYFVFLSF